MPRNMSLKGHSKFGNQKYEWNINFISSV